MKQKLGRDLLNHLRMYAIITVYGLFAGLLIEKFHAAYWLIYVAAASAIITHYILENSSRWPEETNQPIRKSF